VTRSALVAAVLLALAGCSHVLTRAGPVTRPGGSEGSTVYVVGDLAFEAPAAWTAEGDDRRLRLLSPGDEATVEVTAAKVEGSDASCLADAEARLARGEGTLTGVRRHPTTFAGAKGVTQEADQGAWHGWAWAACAGGLQYRVWFAARSPGPKELLEARRRLVDGARFGAAAPAGAAAGGGR
jgi:hypothetical protein